MPTQTANNTNANIIGTNGVDVVQLRYDQTQQGNRAQSAVVRTGNGNDHIGLDAFSRLNASLNGGNGNDNFYLNLPNDRRAHNSTINVNGDAGVDTVRIANPDDYTFTHDGRGTVTLRLIPEHQQRHTQPSNSPQPAEITLTGIEKISFNRRTAGPDGPGIYTVDINEMILTEGLRPNVPTNLGFELNSIVSRG